MYKIATYVDINECFVDKGGCEHNCENLEGINLSTGLGYQCECMYGYQLAPDKHNCNGTYYLCVDVCMYAYHVIITILTAYLMCW